MELQIAKCCGSCIHSNKPKKPEDHAAHYEVAKTERWCYKNECITTRETICDNYEVENKKGAMPAFKRILAFNKRLEWLKEIVQWMQDNNIQSLDYHNTRYTVINDRLYYGYSYHNDDKRYYHLLSCKSNSEDKNLKYAIENYKESMKI